MEGIDWNLIAKDAAHNAPFFLGILSLAWRFMHLHQKSTEKIEISVKAIEISLAAADLPKMRRDIEKLQEYSTRFEQILKLRTQ